jgi:hypothetical protein
LLEPANEDTQATLVRLLRATGHPREAEEYCQTAERCLQELNAARTGAFSVPIESEREPYLFVWSHFLGANRHPLC